MDISQNSITLAKNHIEENGLKADKYICGDARNLQYEMEDSYDGILLLGPMYHITNKKRENEPIKSM